MVLHSFPFLSVAEVARRMRLSRMQVIRKIHKGEILARKVGRAYLVPEDGLPGIYRKLTAKDRRRVDWAVGRVLTDYKETIQRLGKS